jgi:U-box domain
MMQRTNDHPQYIVCPITFMIFREPVIIMPGGKICEWEALDAIIAEAQKQHVQLLCPVTRMPVTGYVKCFNTSEVVNEYLKNHPDAAPAVASPRSYNLGHSGR